MGAQANGDHAMRVRVQIFKAAGVQKNLEVGLGTSDEDPA